MRKRTAKKAASARPSMTSRKKETHEATQGVAIKRVVTSQIERQ